MTEVIITKVHRVLAEYDLRKQREPFDIKQSSAGTQRIFREHAQNKIGVLQQGYPKSKCQIQ